MVKVFGVWWFEAELRFVTGVTVAVDLEKSCWARLIMCLGRLSWELQNFGLVMDAAAKVSIVSFSDNLDLFLLEIEFGHLMLLGSCVADKTPV